ncbi:hypothetical protein [Roseobacter sp. HKCCA0434]|uniref:hypothetical protein n=1 Tax=Roseobacter sp. HKCCA0434 TaxID=3079297 RepID=UPI002905A43D|nr:hypothetical protein [Roseobacter sp. HKCCA0434]
MPRPFTKLTASTLALATVLAPLPALAQDDAVPVEEITFEEPERVAASDCWFVEGNLREVITEDADYREIAVALREAEPDVRAYVEDSLAMQQDAIGHAFRDFAAWYTHRVEEQNAERLEQQQIAELVGKGLEKALSVALPGSGVVVSTLRTAGSAAYDQVVQNTTGGSTDPQTYLDRLAGEIEDDEAARNTMVRAMFNDRADQALRDRVETIKFEYVMEQRAAMRNAAQAAGERTADSCSGRMLDDIGIPRPSVANTTRIRREMLQEMMFEAMCMADAANEGTLSGNIHNYLGNCQSDEANTQRIARAGATRLILVGRANVATMWQLTDAAQLSSVCWDEYFSSGYNPDCARWRADNL